RFPPKKHGYKKDKDTKKYQKDPAKSEGLQEFFNLLGGVTTIEELIKLLNTFSSKLKCEKDRLVSIARDPFYAGFDLSMGENRLPHVEPYVDLETFYAIQDSCGHIINAYIERVDQLKGQNTFLPVCGLCKEPMIYRYDVLQNFGSYSCS